MSKKIDYHASVNYEQADPAKVLAQKEGRATAKNMPYGFKEVSGTRGESAYVFDMGESYGALVQEGLGTKSLIAQAVYAKTGKSFFGAIAQDTVATVINDLISVGATPVVLNAYWSAGSYDWLTDRKLAEDFIKGWRSACDKAGVVWGGGETQSLSGIVEAGALEFAGSGFGIIKDKKRLISDQHIQVGDKILLIESSGVHANGISLIREVAKGLKNDYDTKMGGGKLFGEVALTPTHLYAKFVQALFEAEINVHYLSNITGHGWRKIMRARGQFTYHITELPPTHEIFNFIAKHAKNNDEEMYGNYNMGTGYAVYLPKMDALKAQEIAKDHGLKSWIAGTVKEGPKQVIIEPKGIVFTAETLGVR